MRQASKGTRLTGVGTLAVAVAAAIAAMLVLPAGGSARSAAAPSNTDEPTVSGNPRGRLDPHRLARELVEQSDELRLPVGQVWHERRRGGRLQLRCCERRLDLELRRRQRRRQQAPPRASDRVEPGRFPNSGVESDLAHLVVVRREACEYGSSDPLGHRTAGPDAPRRPVRGRDGSRSRSPSTGCGAMQTATTASFSRVSPTTRTPSAPVMSTMRCGRGSMRQTATAGRAG